VNAAQANTPRKPVGTIHTEESGGTGEVRRDTTERRKKIDATPIPAIMIVEGSGTTRN
jgi:hypothetical protein